MSDVEKIQVLRAELERLRDIVTEEDVASIDLILAMVDAKDDDEPQTRYRW